MQTESDMGRSFRRTVCKREERGYLSVTSLLQPRDDGFVQTPCFCSFLILAILLQTSVSLWGKCARKLHSVFMRLGKAWSAPLGFGVWHKASPHGYCNTVCQALRLNAVLRQTVKTPVFTGLLRPRDINGPNKNENSSEEAKNGRYSERDDPLRHPGN